MLLFKISNRKVYLKNQVEAPKPPNLLHWKVRGFWTRITSDSLFLYRLLYVGSSQQAYGYAAVLQDYSGHAEFIWESLFSFEGR